MADGASVFWGNDGDGTIVRADTCGAAVVAIATGQTGPLRLAVDATSVYWTDASASSVMKAPKDGGPASMVSNTGEAVMGPMPLALNATSVFWTATINAGLNGLVMKAPISGGPAVWMSSALNASPSGAIAADATAVFWAGGVGTTNGVWRCPLSGCGANPTFIVAAQNARRMTVDATTLYWTDGSIVASCPKAGGSQTTLANAQSAPSGIATDSANVYWANGGGTIMRCAVGGCGLSPTTLASGQSAATVAVDSTNVYWANLDGTVMKVAK